MASVAEDDFSVTGSGSTVIDAPIASWDAGDSSGGNAGSSADGDGTQERFREKLDPVREAYLNPTLTPAEIAARTGVSEEVAEAAIKDADFQRNSMHYKPGQTADQIVAEEAQQQADTSQQIGDAVFGFAGIAAGAATLGAISQQPNGIGFDGFGSDSLASGFGAAPLGQESTTSSIMSGLNFDAAGLMAARDGVSADFSSMSPSAMAAATQAAKGGLLFGTSKPTDFGALSGANMEKMLDDASMRNASVVAVAPAQQQAQGAGGRIA